MKRINKILNILIMLVLLTTNFIPIVDATSIIGKIAYMIEGDVNVREGPGIGYTSISKIAENTSLKIISNPSPKGNGCDEEWYHVEYDSSGSKGYICSKYIAIAGDYDFESELKKFPESYHASLRKLNKEFPAWVFKALETGLDFTSAVNIQSAVGKSLIIGSEEGYRSTLGGSYIYETDTFIPVEGNTWFAANAETVAYYSDPRNFLNDEDIFMFETLTYIPTYQTKAVVDKVFTSDFLKQYSTAVMEAGAMHNVSPVHLAARIRQEVGVNGSAATSGAKFTYSLSNKKYQQLQGQTFAGNLYNFYNIGATTDSVPVQNGLIYAMGGADGTSTTFGRPWNTPEKSIVGGAEFISSGYINAGQYTQYLQRWNVNPNALHPVYTHQYMTNVKAAYSEAWTSYKSYRDSNLLNEQFVFSIPIYKNMPTVTKLPNTGNPNNYLKELTINGRTLSGFSNTKYTYDIYVSTVVNSINIEATKINSKTQITGIGNIKLTDKITSLTVGVTAENGAQRNFILNVIKSDETPISVDEIINNIGVKSNGGYISGINIGTNVQSIDENVKKLNALATTVVKDSNDKIKNSDNFVTGDKVTISSFGEEKTYTVVIYGDTDGDGSITIRDLLRVQKHLLGNKLSGAYLEAADVSKNNNVEILDLLMIQKHLLGSSNIKQ